MKINKKLIVYVESNISLGILHYITIISLCILTKHYIYITYRWLTYRAISKTAKVKITIFEIYKNLIQSFIITFD